jgi:hypothetical protein
VLDGALRGFARVSFDSWKQLSVKFAGEDGIDDGGLTREFLRLLMRAVQEMPLFQGNTNSKMIVLDAASKYNQNSIFGYHILFIIVYI